MPDYELEQQKCEDFLQNFVSEYSIDSTPKYAQMLQEIANRATRVLEIDLNDLQAYQNDDELVDAVVGNTKRYMSVFAAAADAVMPIPTVLHGGSDMFDVITETRARQQDQAEAAGLNVGQLPPSVTRRFEVVFLPLAKDKVMPLRQVGAPHVGRLVTCQGIVVRCTDVKPMCTVACFTCSHCTCETFLEVTGREFTPLDKCGNTAGAGCTGKPLLRHRTSRFVKFQEIKLQEPAGDVPQGSVPRTMTVYAKGELTRQVKPGEMVTITGIFLPVPFTGYKAMKAGLLTQTFLEAMAIHKEKQSYEDALASPQDRAQAQALFNQGGQSVYDKLASSIAPEIFGHDDVKKVLLLMMVGGVTKTTDDGMRMRGDIHVCLMGDPGVAKSQLLKQVATISPRSVYTTGKGSSGVGLTAAVMRDPTTGEMVLEGGALVLADKGICCIDEFDKMEEQDRTAIHEAMEQQTVSIAKGGITTTLNTRATVLAAANPAGGSYDLKRSPEDNINLPAALLSRFDFLWLLLDKPDAEADRLLAEHVLKVHRTKNHLGKDEEEMEQYQNNPQESDPVSASVVRSYVGMVRGYNPVVPEDLAGEIADIYSQMRQGASEHQVVTARQLLSVLRMAQALARVFQRDHIVKEDLSESQRLLMSSKESLAAEKAVDRVDTVSAIYSRIATYMMRRKQAIKAKTMGILAFDDIKRIVRDCNFPCTDNQIRIALKEYSELGVLQLDDDYNIVLEGGDRDVDMDEALDAVQFPSQLNERTVPDSTRLNPRKRRRSVPAEAVEAADE